MIKMNATAIVALLVCSISAYGQSSALQGLSGVAVGPDALYLVGDKSHGAVFTVNDWQPPVTAGQFTLGSLQRTTIRATTNPQNTKDLEAVALMGDAPVILAEESSKLFSLTTLLADYSEIAKEDNGIGFEGLAVRSTGTETFEVAVLNEGGWDKTSGRAKEPFIIVNRISSTMTQPFVADSSVGNYTRISVSEPNLNASLGIPSDIAIRAPGLAWYPYDKGPKTEWGFIVLITVGHPAYYDRLWLYRIRGDQRDIFDLKQVMGEDLARLNWEGIDWIDQRRLLLAADHDDDLILYIIELPSHWNE